MQKIKCPACLGTKEYPHTGNVCIRCDGKGYVEFGETALKQMEIIEAYQNRNLKTER